jgi:hypothetical protein
MSSAMDLTDRRFRAAKRIVLWRYVLALLAVTVLMVATSVPAEASKTAPIGTPPPPSSSAQSASMGAREF